MAVANSASALKARCSKLPKRSSDSKGWPLRVQAM